MALGSVAVPVITEGFAIANPPPTVTAPHSQCTIGDQAAIASFTEKSPAAAEALYDSQDIPAGGIDSHLGEQTSATGANGCSFTVTHTIVRATLYQMLGTGQLPAGILAH